jgi:hypothetical protein
MALATRIEAIDHRAAAMTAASIHLHYEDSVVETPLGDATGVDGIAGVAVVATAQGIVEWFPHPDQGLDDLASAARSISGTGWTVTVIVRSDRMGEAHRALRGAPVILQPWWADGETVRFGGPEVP